MTTAKDDPARGKPTKPTLEDVATAAGISAAAASKALNNRADVSPETRRRVLKIARDLGYEKTTRRRKARPSTLISVVCDGLTYPYSPAVLLGAISGAGAARTTITVDSTEGDDPSEPRVTAPPLSIEWFRETITPRHLGIITIAMPIPEATSRLAAAAGVPMVAIDAFGNTYPSVATIGSTNWNGGLEATEHLIAQGHRRIAFLAGDDTLTAIQERMQGYLSGLRKHGLPVDESLIIRGSAGDAEAGLEGGRTLFARPREEWPTAVFARSDTVALGLYEAAREVGLTIPDELSVIGFDDTHGSSWASPHLTTVHQPLMTMGREAVRLIVDHHNGRPIRPGTALSLATRLIIRDSTSSPRKT